MSGDKNGGLVDFAATADAASSSTATVRAEREEDVGITGRNALLCNGTPPSERDFGRVIGTGAATVLLLSASADSAGTCSCNVSNALCSMMKDFLNRGGGDSSAYSSSDEAGTDNEPSGRPPGVMDERERERTPEVGVGGEE